jgi:hypothetical protein
MIKNRYTFICERVDDDNYIEESRIEVRNNDLTYLPDVLNEFEQFIRGCGFHAKGNLIFVADDERIENVDISRFR